MCGLNFSFGMRVISLVLNICSAVGVFAYVRMFAICAGCWFGFLGILRLCVFLCACVMFFVCVQW